jgi:hypothetical protein
MAKQTFTTGQVLTAAQMTSLQQTAMQGGAASAKTASYTLVAADAGSAISMSNASATTITVNTALFAAGDTVHITNLGAGVCTITAGTATVNSSASLALAQYESGFLDFTSTSAAIFIKGAGAAAAGGGMTLLSTTTLSGASTTISSIDQTYTDLSVRIISPLTSANGYLAIDPNASTTISDNIQLESVGTIVQGTSRGSDEIRFNYNTAMKSDNAAQVALLTICNYASTSYRKPIIGSYAYVAGGDSSKRQGYVGGMINTTSAISSLVITTIGGTSFSSGTVLVYGVK